MRPHWPCLIVSPVLYLLLTTADRGRFNSQYPYLSRPFGKPLFVLHHPIISKMRPFSTALQLILGNLSQCARLPVSAGTNPSYASTVRPNGTSMLCPKRYSSAASTRWKQRQGRDQYSREAKAHGLKSRAAFKLVEVRGWMDAKEPEEFKKRGTINALPSFIN